MNTLMEEIRAFGRVPRLTEGNCDKADYVLAERLRWARRQHLLSESQLAELATMPKYVASREVADRISAQVSTSQGL